MILDICLPPITSHNFYALPLSIIVGDAQLNPWIYNEFIQIYTSRNREDDTVCLRLYKKDNNELFKYEPLYETIISPERLVFGDCVIDVYRALLKSGQYIYDFVDKFFISHFAYPLHFVHDLLVYGYDDQKDVFHAYSYSGAKLTKFDISYKDYILAFNSGYSNNRLESDISITTLFRKKRNVFDLDIKRIRNYIIDYLDGTNTFNRDSLFNVNLYKAKFGIETYDEIKHMINYGFEKNLRIDLPSIRCIFDHKKLMQERMDFLNSNTTTKCPNFIKEKIDLLCKNADIFLMLVLKYNYKGISDRSSVDLLTKHVDKLKELEENLYAEYYNFNHSQFEEA